MAQVLVQIPDRLLESLEKTREAYRRMPDDDSDWFDARVWDEWKPPLARGRRRKSRKT
jgi:hypothetical protein